MINILIRYLGIKTKLLEPIKSAIQAVTPKGATVVDLFAGSTTVGQYLINDFIVYANDCQRYSYITAKVLIEYHSPKIISALSKEKLYGEFYYDNYNRLKSIFASPLKQEEILLADIGDIYYGNEFDAFTNFFNNSPYYGHTNNKNNSFDDCLNMFSIDNIKKYKRNPCRFPYMLFCTYYNNPYFSLHQCVEIDSLMYSIQKLLSTNAITEEEYNIYLSFIIYALNLTVISVGDHFAQPQKIKLVSPTLDAPRDSINIRERKKIISKKRTSVESLITDKLDDFKLNYVQGNKENKAFCLDFHNMLEGITSSEVTTVYIDPPYTNAHYSRFYHIPETLVLYDYPEIKYFGRYRSDRYQSGFCIKTAAASEFDDMISLCKSKGLNIVISYSDTAQCILKIGEITSICQKYYGNSVDIQNIAHMYRNFGQKPNRVLAKEYLITCKQ